MKSVYSIDVMITERCNASCRHCINKSYRTASEMPLPDFVKLADYLSTIGFTQIRIMGGEPTIHVDFVEIAKVAQSKFAHVVIMTNGRGRALSHFTPRESDRIVYNMNALPLDIEDAMLKADQKGDRVFSVVFAKDSDSLELVEKACRITSVSGMLKRAVFDIVIDLTENLFEIKSGIQEKVRTFYEKCLSKGIKMSIAAPHELVMLYPKCFREYSTDPIGTAPAKLCNRSSPGHIDAELYWRFCHAFPVRLGKVVDISWDDACKRAAQCCADRLEITRKRCGKCALFGGKCDGGCFALTKLDGYRDIEAKWKEMM